MRLNTVAVTAGSNTYLVGRLATGLEPQRAYLHLLQRERLRVLAARVQAPDLAVDFRFGGRPVEVRLQSVDPDD